MYCKKPHDQKCHQLAETFAVLVLKKIVYSKNEIVIIYSVLCHLKSALFLSFVENKRKKMSKDALTLYNFL